MIISRLVLEQHAELDVYSVSSLNDSPSLDMPLIDSPSLDMPSWMCIVLAH